MTESWLKPPPDWVPPQFTVDLRLPVSLEVMALLESDFPEAAALFQVDPMWLEHYHYYRYPHRFLLGFDGSHDGDVSVFQVDPRRLWAIPTDVVVGTALDEGDIRADERKLVCAEEGHRETDRTQLDSTAIEIQCGRCGHEWTRPRPVYCTCAWIDVSRAVAGHPAVMPGRKDPACPIHGQDQSSPPVAHLHPY